MFDLMFSRASASLQFFSFNLPLIFIIIDLGCHFLLAVGSDVCWCKTFQICHVHQSATDVLAHCPYMDSFLNFFSMRPPKPYLSSISPSTVPVCGIGHVVLSEICVGAKVVPVFALIWDGLSQTWHSDCTQQHWSMLSPGGLCRWDSRLLFSPRRVCSAI